MNTFTMYLVSIMCFPHNIIDINTICFIFTINYYLSVYQFCELKNTIYINIFKKALQIVQILSLCLNNHNIMKDKFVVNKYYKSKNFSCCTDVLSSTMFNIY